MIEFRKIELGDKQWIDKLLKKSDFQGCEYSFANNIAWQRLSDTKIARVGDFYLSANLDKDYLNLTYPSGDGDFKALIETLSSFAKELSRKLKLISVTEQGLLKLNSAFGSENLVSTYDRDNSDYIYNANDLIELKGKKYHGKRNHIARFKESSWHFEPITKDKFDDCFEFSAKSYNSKNDYDDYSAVIEQYAINMFLTNFEYLNLRGGVLYQNDRMVGFTVGEQLNSNTFVVHIEKALADVQGAYPCLCQEFAKMYAKDFKYINREEDLGIEGLRKSKESYRPCYMLNKYAVTFKS